ncbi:MAG: hypothetical protein EA352_02020 [Gemmatimonadales bacterium]|nr:MAG: hypothetical protein EA352_02020 [Gemmatimonadales bacterium]
MKTNPQCIEVRNPMLRTVLPVMAALILLPTSAWAQAHGDHGAHSQHAAAMDRAIKALSSDEVEGLLEGEGMGYALAAELNSYPGPGHVLELEEELSLTEDQLAEVNRIFQDMNERAREVGARLVEAERELDELFRSRSATSDGVRELVMRIGALEGEVRFAHLEAHLLTTALLTEEQIHRYDVVRGYGHDHGSHGPG